MASAASRPDPEPPAGAWAASAAAASGVRPTRTVLDVRMLRGAGALMLALAAVWPWLPWHPPHVEPLELLLGIPGPFEGMTRSVTAAVHGHLGASLSFNPAGIPFVLAALALLGAWRVESVTIPRWLIPAGLALMWAYNLTLNPTF